MAKSKNSRTPTRTGPRARGREAGFEIQDQDQGPESGAGGPEQTEGRGAAPGTVTLEQMVVLVTCVALVVAFLLSQIDLASSYGKGLFGS